MKATYDGVVRLPWSLATISTRSFCHTPTHEYVVPRSIPATASCGDALGRWSPDASAHACMCASCTSICDQRLTDCWGCHGAKRHSAAVFVQMQESGFSFTTTECARCESRLCAAHWPPDNSGRFSDAKIAGLQVGEGNGCAQAYRTVSRAWSMSESRFKLKVLEPGLAGALRIFPVHLDQLRFENSLHVPASAAHNFLSTCETACTTYKLSSQTAWTTFVWHAATVAKSTVCMLSC